jgi:hypothetical protein
LDHVGEMRVLFLEARESLFILDEPSVLHDARVRVLLLFAQERLPLFVGRLIAKWIWQLWSAGILDCLVACIGFLEQAGPR